MARRLPNKGHPGRLPAYRPGDVVGPMEVVKDTGRRVTDQVVWLVRYRPCGHEAEHRTDKLTARQSGCPVCPKSPAANAGRDREIVLHLLDHTQQAVADAFGVSRARIGQVVRGAVAVDALRAAAVRRAKPAARAAVRSLRPTALLRHARQAGMDLTPYLSGGA